MPFEDIPDLLHVKCGVHDLKAAANEQPKPPVEPRIQSITMHPFAVARDRVKFKHDMALIHLHADIKLDEHVDTVCLPKSNEK